MKLSSAFLASASVISQQRYPCNGRKAEEVTCDEATWVFSCPMASNSADEIVDEVVNVLRLVQLFSYQTWSLAV